MNLFDKIKDLFYDDVTDDEEIDLEEEEKKEYQEPKDVLPKVMRDTILKEEEKKVEINNIFDELKEQPKADGNALEHKKFSFPIDFEDELPKRNSKSSNNTNSDTVKVEKEAPKKIVELYPKKENAKDKPKFKATPVISPVYGILDKNYKKEEVKEKSEENFEMKRPSKKVDFETVRKKAFGNLSDDIKDNLMCENCELYKEAKKNSILSEDDLLYDMTVDEEEVTINKAYEDYEEFGVAYEVKNIHMQEDVSNDVDSNLDENIDNSCDNNDEEKEDIIINSESGQEIIEKSVPSREEKKKDEKVDDDFFKLIDSMYKERVDD